MVINIIFILVMLNKFNITQIKISSSLFYSYIKRNGELTVFNKDISSFKIKVTWVRIY